MSMIEDMEEAPHTVLRCPECTALNLRQQNFCAKCGTPLWRSCLQCGAMCAVGEKFCGACGANLEETAANNLERVEADLCRVDEMRSACRFSEAMALLVRLTKNEHPNLTEHVARAKRLILELTAERDRRRVEAEEDCQLARQRFAVFDVDGAAELLEGVPAPLRGGAVETFRAEVMARRQEIAALNEELHAAVRQNRFLDLPPKIERLLILKPDHAYARELAEKVQQHLVVAAEKCLAEYQYDKALGLLEQIAPHVRTPRAEQLRGQIAELACLAWDLRNAPVVDATLTAVAERLRRLAPRDARAGKLCAELQRRSRLAESQGRGVPLPWARPPQQTALGVPVEWFAGFRRIRCAETLQQPDLVQNAGRFATACGLALTGLKRASLPINLLAGEQGGVLSRVTQLVRSRSERPAWGIDLGPSGLKAIKLAWDDGKQQVVIEAAALIEHAKSLSHAANDAEERRLVGDTLRIFLDSQETKAARVCVGMPGRMALSRPLEVPPIAPGKVPKFVEFEARYQFPFPLQQLSWDFQLLDGPRATPNGAAEAEEKESRRALLIGAKRTATQHFLEPFQRLGLRVDALQTDFVGLHNLLMHEYFSAEDDASAAAPPAAVAAFDVGCDATNLVVSSPYSLWHHTCGLAGQTFTRALVKELNLSIAQAEQHKRAPELQGRMSDLYAVLGPVFEALLKETQEALAAYAQAQPDRPLRHIVGLGGGFSLHGLLRYLRCGR
jgi:Tfp pilus assembly PilM family ATPase